MNGRSLFRTLWRLRSAMKTGGMVSGEPIVNYSDSSGWTNPELSGICIENSRIPTFLDLYNNHFQNLNTRIKSFDNLVRQQRDHSLLSFCKLCPWFIVACRLGESWTSKRSKIPNACDTRGIDEINATGLFHFLTKLCLFALMRTAFDPRVLNKENFSQAISAFILRSLKTRKLPCDALTMITQALGWRSPLFNDFYGLMSSEM